jgi:hypothetical protein
VRAFETVEWDENKAATNLAKHETVCVFDEERDQYALLNVTWGQCRCVHGAQVFVRLRDGKIWIEEDWTEDGIATKLLEHGVPKDDIVLAFHPPEVRPFTEFAVAEPLR